MAVFLVVVFTPPLRSGDLNVSIILLVTAALLLGQGAADWLEGRFERGRPRLSGNPPGDATVTEPIPLLRSDRRPVDEQLHEVRASLAGVLCAFRLLAGSDSDLPDHLRRHLTEMLDRELHRLGRVLDGCAAAPEPCPLDTALEPVIASRRLAGQDVSWRRTGHWAHVGADRVAEIVNILLVNADRHAHGTPVLVDVTAVPGEVHVRVSDRGPGIPVAQRSRVLHRGGRGEESPGWGLGLAVASRLATEVGGELRILEVPQGAAFDVCLPAASPGVCA